MTAIVSVFWRICIFKTGPDAVPASTAFLALAILFNAITSLAASALIQSILPSSPPGETMEVQVVSDGVSLVTSVVVSQASTAGLVWLLLTLLGFGRRTYQTLTAVFGTDIILTSLTALAVTLSVVMNPMLSQFVFLGMFFWTVGVLGFILHKALEISRGFGIAAALFVLIFTIAITQVTIAL